MPTLYETKYMLRGYQKNVEALRVNDADVTYNFAKDIIEKYKPTVLANEARILSVVKRYIALNASKLGARAPINKIPFTDHDKSALFIAAGIKEKEIQESINKLAGTNNIDIRNNVINNPFNVLCSILTSIFFMADPKRNDKKRDFTKPYYYTSLYLSIQFYGKIYISSFPKADPQASVMDYTIENISNKFLMKKVNNVFEIIKYFSESNIENMYNRLERHADIDLIYFSSNLYNRMHNSMKTLASEFYKNKKEKNYIGTETSNMTDDSGDFYVGNVTNISASIDSAVKKVVMKFVSDSVIDDTILNAACAKTKFSKAKMTLILHRMREQNDPLMQTIMAEIISYYLIAYKKPESAIKSSEFALSMIKLYGISNTKDNQVLNIKKHLGQLIQKNSKNILKEGNENMLERVKNALFVYFVLFIVKNIE